MVLLIARTGGVSANSSWEYQNDERGSGHGFSSTALEISVNLGPALLPLHCQTDKRREREMDDRGCIEELIEVY